MRLLVLLFVFVSWMDLYGESRIDTLLPSVGNKCPPFELRLEYPNSTKTIETNDLKGKWTILYFWHLACLTCPEKFPHLDSLQKKFSNDLQIILVGYTGSQFSFSPDDLSIRKLYKNINDSLHLIISAAFDSTIFHKFDVYSGGTTIILDPNSIVRALTYRVLESDISDFIKGKNPRVPKAWLKNENKIKYDPEVPFLIHGNGGNEEDFEFRSMLTKYKEYMPGRVSYKIGNRGLEVMGVGIASLYKYAYLGIGVPYFGIEKFKEYYPQPVIKVKDSSLFTFDPDLRDNLYCYSLIMPQDRVDENSLRKSMQRDLANYFGFRVTLKRQGMPCYLLRKIKDNGQNKEVNDLDGRFEFRSKKEMLREIFQNNLNSQIPIFDMTNDSSVNKIYIKDKSSIHLINESLRKIGYEIVLSSRIMKTLIIHD